MARLHAIPAGILILLSAQACRKADKAATPPTITLIDQIWPDAESRRRHNEEFRQFTRETGIRVELLLAPPEDSLTVSRQLLATQGSVADVYAVDVIWPSILAEQLIDLKPYIPAQEIAEQSPHLVANFTVNGRLVGLPYYFETGLLFYRTDLLQKYGYRAPPATWEELEKIAARIQAGERAQGKRNFWGFVWQGAPSEALTCNALEWQASEGGGSIIENGAVTVNNPATNRAWERAGRWVGSISPPGVVAYHESDTKGRWQSGGAAFMRNWSNTYLAAVAESSAVRGKFAVCPLPKGRAGICWYRRRRCLRCFEAVASSPRGFHVRPLYVPAPGTIQTEPESVGASDHTGVVHQRLRSAGEPIFPGGSASLSTRAGFPPLGSDRQTLSRRFACLF
jgi:trehalose/maltose transport system substrate-binding protein